MITSDFNPSVSHPFYFIRKGLLQYVGKYAQELQGDLLDFGCGAKPYRDLFHHVTSYTGVDFENEGHGHANEQIDVFYDGKTLPFNNEVYDAVFCSEVFEHLFNLPEILKELNRVLKPGGKMLITCPFVWPEHEKPHDFARYTWYALQSEVEKAGFEVVTIDKSGDFFTTVLQLRALYFYYFILPKLSNRFLVKMVGKIVFSLFNSMGLLLRKLLPTNKDLYLNNVIIVKKKN